MANQSPERLVAADIMQRDIVTIATGDSLREALAQMTENHVTGLPVMDGQSRCVGLVSATDILGYEYDHAEETAEANSDLAQYFNPDTQQWEGVRLTSFALEEFGDVRVEEVMARELVSVSRDMPLGEVAAKMAKEGIHRVLVLGQKGQLYGIVAATDFVRLYAEQET